MSVQRRAKGLKRGPDGVGDLVERWGGRWGWGKLPFGGGQGGHSGGVCDALEVRAELKHARCGGGGLLCGGHGPGGGRDDVRCGGAGSGVRNDGASHCLYALLELMHTVLDSGDR